jgi:hypothetical protein
MPSGVTRIVFFCSIGIILILVLWFYSGLSSRVRTVYRFILCVVSLLSSRFTASVLVWFYNFLKCSVFHFFISLNTVFVCRSSWILYQSRFRMDRRFLDWKRWKKSVFIEYKIKIFLKERTRFKMRVPRNFGRPGWEARTGHRNQSMKQKR